MRCFNSQERNESSLALEQHLPGSTPLAQAEPPHLLLGSLWTHAAAELSLGHLSFTSRTVAGLI